MGINMDNEFISGNKNMCTPHSEAMQRPTRPPLGRALFAPFAPCEPCAMDNECIKSAWVVFTNQSELKSVRCLKRGFKHCFVLINDRGRWVSIDPMAHYMEVLVHDFPGSFDFAAWLEEKGHHVAKAQFVQGVTSGAPLSLFTCVEACKRILGIHKRSIITPWQLYRHLTNK